MAKDAPVKAVPADNLTGFRLDALLERHRERIICEWRDRLFKDVSDNYAARNPEELGKTTARAYDAFFHVLAENDYTAINRFINDITSIRLESGFPWMMCKRRSSFSEYSLSRCWWRNPPKHVCAATSNR